MQWKLVHDDIDGCSLQLRHCQFRVVVYKNLETHANNPESSCWFAQIVGTREEALSLGEEKFKEFMTIFGGCPLLLTGDCDGDQSARHH